MTNEELSRALRENLTITIANDDDRIRVELQWYDEARGRYVTIDQDSIPVPRAVTSRE